MTLSNIYAGKPIKINGTNTLLGITKQSYDPRVTKKDYANSGSIQTRLSSFIQYAPIMKFSTLSVSQLLGILTNTETPMVALDGTDGILMTLGRVNAAAPGYDSTLHQTRKFSSGHVYLDSLSWSIGSDGLSADCTAFGISADGTADAVVASTSSSLPSDGAETPWQLTGATIGGTAIDSITSFSATFAHKAENNTPGSHTMGLPFPLRVVPPGAGGGILITGELDILDHAFALSDTGNIVLTFSQSEIGAGFSSGAGTLVLTFAGNAIEVAPIDAGQGPATRKVKFTSTYIPSVYPFSHTP
jgi:hypothetical protein